MWKKEDIPLNDDVYIWIKPKFSHAKNQPVVIEARADKSVSIHYQSDMYSVDLDRKDK
jgi:hypothetical protein